MTTLNERLEWRYATKKFDASKTVETEKLERIIECRSSGTDIQRTATLRTVCSHQSGYPRQNPYRCLGSGAGHRLFSPAGIRGMGRHHAGTRQHDV